MSFLSAELSNFLSRPAELYHFRTGVTNYYFTSSDKTINHNGIDWIPETISRSSIKISNNITRSDLVLRMSQQNPLRDFIFNRGIKRELELTIYRYQMEEGLSETSFSGVMGMSNVKNELEIEMTFQQIGSIATKTSQRYTYSFKCNHDQYSSACGLDILANSVTSPMDSIVGNKVTIVDNGAAVNFYKAGLIWIDKAGLREKRYIIEDDTNTLVGFRILTLDIFFDEIELTDIINLAAGCSNNSINCKSLGNFENFLGFEHIPDDNYYTDGIRDANKGYAPSSGRTTNQR
jgi:hypothetical protein